MNQKIKAGKKDYASSSPHNRIQTEIFDDHRYYGFMTKVIRDPPRSNVKTKKMTLNLFADGHLGIDGYILIQTVIDMN